MDFPPRLYYSEIEFEFRSGEKSSQYAGGMTFTFVNAPDARTSLTMIESAAKELSLKIVSVEFVALYEDVEWQDSESQSKYDSLAKEAINGSSVVFDELWAYRET